MKRYLWEARKGGEMQVNNALSSRNLYQMNKVEKMSQNQFDEFSCAVNKSEEGELEGEFLGLTMLPEKGKSMVYGMRAVLSPKATSDKPIVQIISNLDGKKEVYDVDISKVNPENATRMEMFALCCYADKYGTGTGSTFGSFHTFKIYEETARLNDCIKQVEENVSAWEQFRNEKDNWIKISESVLDVLRTHKDPKVMDLFSKGKKLEKLYLKHVKEKVLD